jgi:murein DD-endopeptidase MepM/ murein hydrolase activator NlpD
MLTKHRRDARRLADRRSGPGDRDLLALHRRVELLVALFVLAAVTVLALAADPASAQAPQTTTKEGEPLEFEATPSAAVPERRAQPLRIAGARANPSRIFLGSRRVAAFRFKLDSDRDRELLVKVVGVNSREVVRRYRLGRVKPRSEQRVIWDGKLAKGGYAPEGTYAFRVFSDGRRAAAKRSSGSQRFGFYGHRFPLLGRHTYGDGFGAGRNHQGQDLFAACGTRVVAARGGRVQARSFHSAAGYYVVIDGRGTGKDYAYMHLSRKGRPPAGSWVRTGQQIGLESDTGNASGCHLHFEIWGAPGWYEGGRAKPPTKALKRWDGWS